VEFLLAGTSFRVASVEARSRVAAAVPPEEVLRAAGIGEYFVLSTCHRVEIYAVAADAAVAQVSLSRVLGQEAYVVIGPDAVRHLCRVACGLDSMVIGEAEIAGQIRRAASQAREAGTVGVLMARVLAGALRASGRARSETRIGVGALSAASAAVSMVERALGDLNDRAVMVVGAGQAGRQALSRLARIRTGSLLVASRSRHHAFQAAEKHGAEVVPIQYLAPALDRVDAVIAASQAPALVLAADDYRAARISRPHFMVDLSVPRVIDPSLAAFSNVTLRTVDDLGDIVRESAARRLKEVPRVEAIVEGEARRAYDAFKARQEHRHDRYDEDDRYDGFKERTDAVSVLKMRA